MKTQASSSLAASAKAAAAGRESDRQAPAARQDLRQSNRPALADPEARQRKTWFTGILLVLGALALGMLLLLLKNLLLARPMAPAS